MQPKMKGHRFLFIHNDGLAYFCERAGRPATIPCMRNHPKDEQIYKNCCGCPKLAARTPYLDEEVKSEG